MYKLCWTHHQFLVFNKCETGRQVEGKLFYDISFHIDFSLIFFFYFTSPGSFTSSLILLRHKKFTVSPKHGLITVRLYLGLSKMDNLSVITKFKWSCQWIVHWLIYWLIDWLNDWLIDWLVDWLTGWLTDWLTDSLIDWLIDLLIDWLIDGLIDWLIDWLFSNWLFDSLINVNRLIDWLIAWLIDQPIDRWPQQPTPETPFYPSNIRQITCHSEGEGLSSLV